MVKPVWLNGWVFVYERTKWLRVRIPLLSLNELAKEFNEYYINIVQNTTGKATIKFKVPIMINPL